MRVRACVRVCVRVCKYTKTTNNYIALAFIKKPRELILLILYELDLFNYKRLIIKYYVQTRDLVERLLRRLTRNRVQRIAEVWSFVLA